MRPEDYAEMGVLWSFLRCHPVAFLEVPRHHLEGRTRTLYQRKQSWSQQTVTAWSARLCHVITWRDGPELYMERSCFGHGVRYTG